MMEGTVPEALLGYLPFTPEPFSQWGGTTDLLSFSVQFMLIPQRSSVLAGLEGLAGAVGGGMLASDRRYRGQKQAVGIPGR